MPRYFALLALSASFLSVRAARAEESHPKAPVRAESMTMRLLRMADRNRDGRVSSIELTELVQREVSLQVQRRMPRLDRNADGRVTRTEVPKMDALRFSRFDLDRDGAFTKSELSAVMQQAALSRCRNLLSTLDLDGDGVLTQNDTGSDRVRVAFAKPEPRVEADPAGSN